MGRTAQAVSRQAWYVILLTCCAASAVVAVELQPTATRAYDSYVERATRVFLERVSRQRNGANDTGVRDTITGRPGTEDGIIAVPDGLVHHWVGAVFIPGVTLRQALDVSSAYPKYPTIYKSILSSRVLSKDESTVRVLFRIKEGAGMVNATLDVRSSIRYFHPDDRHVYAVSSAEEIREVKNAGESDERLLPAGQDSGYLWRASTLSSFVERDGGLYVEMETLGLSRRFPTMLAWIIEPIARRLGRKSVEGSLEEFRQAVLAGPKR